MARKPEEVNHGRTEKDHNSHPDSAYPLNEVTQYRGGIKIVVGEPEENKIRKRNTVLLQVEMGKQIKEKRYRFKLAQHTKDNTRKWDLAVASVEVAVIKCFKLERRDEQAMRGRSKVRSVD